MTETQSIDQMKKIWEAQHKIHLIDLSMISLYKTISRLRETREELEEGLK